MKKHIAVYSRRHSCGIRTVCVEAGILGCGVLNCLEETWEEREGTERGGGGRREEGHSTLWGFFFFLKGILSPWRHLQHWLTQGRGRVNVSEWLPERRAFSSQVFVLRELPSDGNRRLQGWGRHTYPRLYWVRRAVYDSQWNKSP